MVQYTSAAHAVQLTSFTISVSVCVSVDGVSVCRAIHVAIHATISDHHALRPLYSDRYDLISYHFMDLTAVITVILHFNCKLHCK